MSNSIRFPVVSQITARLLDQSSIRARLKLWCVVVFVSISWIRRVGFYSLLIAALVGAESLESAVGITGANPGQPLNLANRCQTVCSAEEACRALMADGFDVHVVGKGGASASPSTLTV